MGPEMIERMLALRAGVSCVSGSEGAVWPAPPLRAPQEGGMDGGMDGGTPSGDGVIT